MNYVEKLFDEVHYAFNLNAATLSGAIDILVIPQLDGTLKCTPFHVRFGKLQLIQSSAKVITIYVNGQKTDLQMKLGQAGEAFFVEEVDEPVPDLLATSPIPSPKSSRRNTAIASSPSTTTTTTTSFTTATTTSTMTGSSSSTSSVISSTSTTSSPIGTQTTKFIQQRDSFDSKEMKPLTSALEEMILQQQHPQNHLIPLPQQLPPSQQKKNTTTTVSPLSSSRPSSPVTVESQSPIGSYIIDCGEHVTLYEQSPSSSPPRAILSSTTTTTTTHTTTSTSEPSSDSESEPKFWRWGGFPKFSIRRNKQQPNQNVSSSQLVQPIPQHPSAQHSPQTNIDIQSSTITTKTDIIAIPSNSDLQSTSIDSTNNGRIEEIIDLPNTNSATSNDNNNISEPVSPIMNSSIRESIESDDGNGTINNNNNNNNNNITIPINMNQTIPIPTPNNTPSNPLVLPEHQSSLEGLSGGSQGGNPSSWSRMGSLLKMFKKGENQNQSNSLSSSTGKDQLDAIQIDSGDESSQPQQPTFIVKNTISHSTTSATININNDNTNGGDDNMFLLDEEQEQQEQQEQQKQEQQQLFVEEIDPSLTYAQIVKENNQNINTTNNIINNNNNTEQQQEQQQEQLEPSNIDKSKGTTIIKTSDPILSSITESLSKLNYESEYPTLQHSQFHHTGGHHYHSHNSLIDHFSISLSLCGHLILDKALQSEPEEKEAFFKEYLISFEHFCSDPTLLKNPHLVAKINDQYYPWSIAGHIILSYLIYRKPITQEALNNLKKKDIEDRLQSIKSIDQQQQQQQQQQSSSATQISGGTGSSNSNNTATAVISNQQPAPTKQSSYWKSWLWKNSNQQQLQLQQQQNQNTVQNQQQISPSSSPPSSFSINNLPSKSEPIPFSNSTNQLSLSAGSIPNTNIVIEDIQRKYTKKTLRPTSDQLKSLGLKKGVNRITFVVSSTLLGTKEVSASIYLWDNTSKIVISDIDGTITKSDVFGQVLPLIGKDWSHIGVAELYSNIKANGYQVIYLTSRAIGQANLTRSYINSVKQVGSNLGGIGAQFGQTPLPFTLPEGPVFMSPNRLLTSFNREVIKRNPEEFKIACLQDIQNIFPTTMSPFYAGFGNRNTDAISYNAVGVPKGKTFTINALGVINTTNTTYNKTYTKINELVQDMFPCQNANKNSVDEQWNEYHYWKKSVIPLHKLDPL